MSGETRSAAVKEFEERCLRLAKLMALSDGHRSTLYVYSLFGLCVAVGAFRLESAVELLEATASAESAELDGLRLKALQSECAARHLRPLRPEPSLN